MVLAIAAGVTLVALLASGVFSSGKHGIPPPPVTTGTSATPLPPSAAKALPFEPGDWGTYGGTFDQIRHSALTEITKSNVNELGRVFSIDFTKIDSAIPKGQQSMPIVVDGIIYVTTSNDHVFAVDGASGKVLWHFKPSDTGIFRNFGVTANRGVAYCDGKLFLLTLDMHIISIDPQTGKLVKQVPISAAVRDAKVEFGYSETQAPVCYKNIVLIGAAGSDYGVRGFFMAYRTDLTPAWPNPYWIIPPEGQDWRAGGRYHGGGTNWNPTTIDVETDTAYITTSNPSPIYQPQARPGPNPRTDSLIAIDLHTGHQRWWQQQLAGDEWGYSTAQPALVYDAKVGGVRRRIVSVGTKEGVWFAYDARSGAPIYGRVQLLNHIEHAPLEPGKPVTVYPSSLGGLNYSPSSYDPGTNYVINNQAETASVLTQARVADVERNRTRGDVDLGLQHGGFGSTPRGWHDYGSVTAIDVNRGRVAWRAVTPEPGRGGITTTATGLAFAGGGDGVLRAYDTATGNLLWSFQTGAQIAADASVYEAHGKEYVAITVGGTPTSSFGGTASRLDVYARGGNQTQSPAPALKPAGPAPGLAASPGRFLSLMAQPRTLGLQVVASLNDLAGARTLDGYANGRLVVRVPQGWRVHVTFTNHATAERNSLVVAASRSNPVPAFDGAATPDPARGTPAGTVVYFGFTASKQGRFVLLSAVPGHASSGQWATFDVGPADSVPELVLDGEVYAINITGRNG